MCQFLCAGQNSSKLWWFSVQLTTNDIASFLPFPSLAQLRTVQKSLTELVSTDEKFHAAFLNVVEKTAVPWMKKQLVAVGSIEASEKTTFYVQGECATNFEEPRWLLSDEQYCCASSLRSSLVAQRRTILLRLVATLLVGRSATSVIVQLTVPLLLNRFAHSLSRSVQIPRP